MLQLVSTRKRHNQIVNHFPYSLTGRWFPQEWWDEMGIPVPVVDPVTWGNRTFQDITDQEIAVAQESYRAAAEARAAEEERERVRLIVEAEEARLAALAARPPLIERIFTAFGDTFFTAVGVPVYRREGAVLAEGSVIQLGTVIEASVEDEGWPDPPPNPRTAPQIPVISHAVTPGYQQIVNLRTNEVMSIMSDEYEIINDEDVARRTAELFDAAQINVDPIFHHVSMGKDNVSGRSTYMEFDLPDMTILPDDRDAHRMRIAVSNSFDGTKKERLLLLIHHGGTGHYGLGFSQHESFAVKHRTGANARLVQQFGTFIHDSVEHNASCIRALRDNQAASADAVAEYLNTNRILSGERNAEKLMGRWMVQGTPNNLWAIYQMFTGIITDDYGRNFSAKISKMEQLNSDVRRVWPNALGAPVLGQI